MKPPDPAATCPRKAWTYPYLITITASMSMTKFFIITSKAAVNMIEFFIITPK